ncbi:ABC transporter ATP-binding protein [Nocardioides humi]|nr:ABC transporter ATP-binding protein [Nocardioides humi]
MLVPSGGIIVATALAFGVLGDVVRDVSADRSATGPASWRRLRTPVVRREATPETTAGEVALELRGLRVLHGDTALVDGVDLVVAPGEVVGVVGESGCGKTLTLSALLRLLPPGLRMSAARLRVGGRDALALTDRGMRALRGSAVAFVPQEPVAGLDPAFTVRAQLRELVRHHDGGSRQEVDRRVRELLDHVRLPDPERVLASHPHELSGGMAQRVAIARALAGRPQVLLADEPTTALDVTVQAEILQLLRDLRDSDGLAIVIVTHDWGVVAELCDRAVVMYAGGVVEQGDVVALFEQPRHPYTRALMEANPAEAGFRRRLRSIPGQVPPADARPAGCAFAERCERRRPDCSSGAIPLVELDERRVRCLHPVGPAAVPLPPLQEEVVDVAAR